MRNGTKSIAANEAVSERDQLRAEIEWLRADLDRLAHLNGGDLP